MPANSVYHYHPLGPPKSVLEGIEVAPQEVTVSALVTNSTQLARDQPKTMTKAYNLGTGDASAPSDQRSCSFPAPIWSTTLLATPPASR